MGHAAERCDDRRGVLRWISVSLSRLCSCCVRPSFFVVCGSASLPPFRQCAINQGNGPTLKISRSPFSRWDEGWCESAHLLHFHHPFKDRVSAVDHLSPDPASNALNSKQMLGFVTCKFMSVEEEMEYYHEHIHVAVWNRGERPAVFVDPTQCERNGNDGKTDRGRGACARDNIG